jgi:hypothetical protein
LRLERFSKSFPGLILGISTRDINDWLRGLKSKARHHKGEELAGKTRNNLRGAVVQLFNFAKENGYTAADATKKIKEVGEANNQFSRINLLRLDTGSGNNGRRHRTEIPDAAVPSANPS